MRVALAAVLLAVLVAAQNDTQSPEAQNATQSPEDPHDHDHDHDDDDDDDDYDVRASSALKGTAIAASLAIGGGSVMVPLRSAWYNHRSGIAGLSGAFSAGVFLALSLLHILPEAHEDMEHEWPDAVHDWNLPYALLTVGYLVILWIQVITNFSHSHAHQPVAEENELNVPKVALDAKDEQDGKRTPGEAAPVYGTELAPAGEAAQHSGQHQRASLVVSKIAAAAKHGGNENRVALVFALHAHSLIEGMVIGLRREPGDVALVMGAVLAHKAFEGFALGANLVTDDPTAGVKVAIHAAAFAFATPIGIAAGWIAESEMPKAAASVINAVSAGTLLYIAATELMPEHFSGDKVNARKKAIVFLVAAAAVYILSTLLHDHDDDHDHDHGHAPH